MSQFMVTSCVYIQYKVSIVPVYTRLFFLITFFEKKLLKYSTFVCLKVLHYSRGNLPKIGNETGCSYWKELLNPAGH